MRHDAYINQFTGHGTSRDRRGATYFGLDLISDEEVISLWRSNFLAAKIIEAEPEEAYKRGTILQMTDKALSEDLDAYAEDLGLESAMVDAAEKARALGGSAIFPAIDGAQGDLSTPLDWSTISTINAFHVLEPRELMPVEFYAGLSSKQFRLPSKYLFTPITAGWGSTIGNQEIHASRLIIFPGRRVSWQVLTGQRMGWGDSCLLRPKEVMADFGLAWGSAATLVHEHGVGVLEMDQFAELMATVEGEQQVWNRVGSMMMMKSSIRALVVDGKDKFTRLASALSGTAEVLNEFKVLMSAASDGQPVSVLFGEGQSGLRTGDQDRKVWHDHVERRRNKLYKPRHELAWKFIMHAADSPTGGTEPAVWSMEFPPLDSPNESEVAKTRFVDMQRAALAVTKGIASADDVADSFYRGDTYSGDIRINWARRNAQAAVAKIQLADMTPDDMAAMNGEDPSKGSDGEPAPEPEQPIKRKIGQRRES